MELILKDESYAIIGAGMEVHRILGAGFAEAVYQEAFEVEMEARGIPYQPQHPLRIHYKERVLNKIYVADVLCYDEVIVEIKALERITSKEESQLLNYLMASKKRLGLLLNFGNGDGMQWKRMAGEDENR